MLPTNRKTAKKTRLALLFLSGVFLTALITFVGLRNFSSFFPHFRLSQFHNPAPAKVPFRANAVGYARQVATSSLGGQVVAGDTKVVLPPQAHNKDLVVSYRAINNTGKQLVANAQIGSMFELTAIEKDTATQVSHFDKPLEIVNTIPADDLKKYGAENLATYFFNTQTRHWDKLPSHYGEFPILL